MADPQKFISGFDYSGFEASNPTTPKPGSHLDDDFAGVATSVNGAIDAIKDLRRPDGKLNNAVVRKDSLATDVLAMMTSGGNPRGAWAPATAYIAKDLVSFSEATYIAVSGHTSGVSFATDLAAGKWLLFTASTNGVPGDVAYFEYFDGTGAPQNLTLSTNFGTDSNAVEVYVKAQVGFERMDPAVYTLSGTTLHGTFPNGSRTVLVFGSSAPTAAAVTAAQTAATNAANSATAAGSSATAAAASASSAAASATTATTKATAASNSAAAAAVSETNAAASAAEAAAIVGFDINDYVRKDSNGSSFTNKATTRGNIGETGSPVPVIKISTGNPSGFVANRIWLKVT